MVSPYNVLVFFKAKTLTGAILITEMIQDIMNINDITKQALHMAYVSESDLFNLDYEVIRRMLAEKGYWVGLGMTIFKGELETRKRHRGRLYT